MLREVPGCATPTLEMSSQPAATSELHDDIFGSAPTSPNLEAQEPNHNDASDTSIPTLANSERSDIPRLRSVHVTNGYRDGISESKAEHVQAGFDEGFSLGAVLGLKAGLLLGILEGVVRAVTPSASVSGEIKGNLITSFVKARDELELRSLFSPSYFGQDGIWTYDVPGADDEVTFRVVADAHPLIVKWTAEIDKLKQDFSFLVQARARPDGDEDHDIGS